MSFTTEWKPVANPDVPCRRCKEAGGIEYREWESSCGGFEDYNYHCTKCGADWWIDGPDA